MHGFDRILSRAAGHPRIGIAALLVVCTGVGFGVGRWQPAGANLSSSTIETVTANLARHRSDLTLPGMTKVAMGTGDMAPMMSPQAAPSLSSLLPGLEAKVAANPGDASLKFLLAQTYMELDQYAKAIPLLEALHRETPNNPQIALLDVKAHLSSANPASLRTALTTLDAIKPDEVDAVELWMVRGRVLARLDQRAPAREAFQKAQLLLTADDPRGSEIDMEMAHLAKGVKVPQ